jgi:hypothetical protein
VEGDGALIEDEVDVFCWVAWFFCVWVSGGVLRERRREGGMWKG